ncbi:MAG: hypothetical protein AAF568_05070 [Pseudomonadota bacterium]
MSLAALAAVSERMLLRDLATLAEARRETLAAEQEIVALRNLADREKAALSSGATPEAFRAVGQWQEATERRLRALRARLAEIAAAEETARASAFQAFGRDRAVALLRAREKAAIAAKMRARAERDGLPV